MTAYLGGLGVPEVFSTAATMAFTSSGMSALVSDTSVGGSREGSGGAGVSFSAVIGPVGTRIGRDFCCLSECTRSLSSLKAHGSACGAMCIAHVPGS